MKKRKKERKARQRHDKEAREGKGTNKVNEEGILSKDTEER